MNNLVRNLRCNQALCRISEGDTTALTVIYDCMGRQMFALALSVLKNYADAEDALQESFLKVLQSINTFRKNGNARAWLLTITRNTAVDILRRKGNAFCTEDIERVANDTLSGDQTERLIIDEALMALGQEDREIITLKVFSGLKFREIAEILGLPLATVQKRYQRALKKLKKELR